MTLALIIAVTCISVAVLAILSSTFAYAYLWRRRRIKTKEGRAYLQKCSTLHHFYASERKVKNLIESGRFRDDDTEGIDVPSFDLESILVATKYFSIANKLGQGGFGPVYKGKLPGGEEIAVKRLSSCSGQGLEEFKNEVLIIAKLQHRNIVRLLGYCAEGDEKMLIYEYMAKKSLDSFIFDRKVCVSLDRNTRFNIILGIARGLLYLHQDSRLRIIHRDLKTSNILLKEEMNPKISDFGLARIFGGKETSANTNRVVGTYGYMSLNCNKEEYFKCVNVGLLCVQEDPGDRPTMSQVVFMLGSESATIPSLKQPAFVVRRCPSSSSRASNSLSKPETVLNNGLTVTLEDDSANAWNGQWWLLCYLVTLLVSHILSLCTCQDKLVPGQNITGNNTLVSSPGTFSLGFFNPENSTKYFLGIRFNTFPNTALVWIANRESPLDAPGLFMLSSDGNLVVLDDTRNLVWSTSASIPASAMNHTTGLLEDSGNLVLSFEEVTLWQSFDHPSDTLLPGMKISLNKTSGQQRRLTSWAALDDPQPGKFTAGIDPQVPFQAIIWKETSRYYRSLMPGKDTKTEFQNQGGSLSYISYNFDVDEVYVFVSISDSSVKMRVWLSPTGQYQQLLWHDSSKSWLKLLNAPSDNCDFYAHCGPNSACRRGESLSSSPCKCLTGFKAKFPNQSAVGDWSGGCVRENVLTCGNGLKGNFSKLEMVKLPDYSVWLNNRSMSECESECRQNCSCTAYAYVNGTDGNTGTCLTWFGELLDLVENKTTYDIYIRVPGSELGTKGLSVNSLKRTIVIAIVSTAVGLLTITFGYFLWKKKLGRIARRVSANISKVSAGGGKNDTELPLFCLRSILAATNNFSEDNKLGEGGFGPVYKGILPENQEVAIKRLSKKSGQGHHEFMNELKLIAKLQHTNLARLLGCCMEEDELILIYEYMPNRSLDKFLFDPSEKTKLDWGIRYRIIHGVAQGVLYIHKYSRLKIIHRDLKASNVLLDGAMNPKVSDFGMARIFDINQTEANTNKVVGTYGYMSPEYALYGHFSEKLDVFSFGVLLLEIVSGKKNALFYSCEISLTLAQWIWQLWKEGREMEVIDASVRETCRIHEALRCIHVGLLCVQEAPADRPTMSSVIHMLEVDEATSLPPSKEPAFSTSRISSPVTTYSKNVVTITLPEPR
uniref:G-type lectin S-receptor-like serine/threonine-protein kinase At4g27290 n=1 Tax=Fragaria vesca subsp. vesca TaxID=101020 RepID=UPI0005CB420B|nr:PREDICTED: G-type lectin S-receptor-like serine/threonine-protein kinase At4g27290 [Fragaria vesca subsp. vesca]